MKIHRLFDVLVLPGALLAGGCDKGDSGDDGSMPGADDDGGSTEAAPAESGTPDDDDGPVGDDAPADDDGPSDDAGTTAGPSSDDGPASSAGSSGEPMGSSDGEPATTGEGSSDGAPELQCSDPPEADDQCGCPCCWVQDCINEDDCCAAFSDLCTP